MAAETLTVDERQMELAKSIVEELSKVRAETSFSFTLTEDGVGAVEETLKLIEWGIGGNKPKIKETALGIFTSFIVEKPGTPLNLHMDEYDLKAVGEVLAVIEKALEQHEDGVLK